MTVTELMPVIKRAAKNVSQQWPGAIEADDLVQEICSRLLETETYLGTVMQMSSVDKYKAVAGIGHQLAREARADYDYYKGSYMYSLKEVKDLLSSGVLVAPPTEFSAEEMDLEAALWELRPNYHAAILRRYADGETPKSKSEENALARGLESLVDKMNRVQKRHFSERRDGPGTRGRVDKSDSYEDAGDFDFGSWANNQGVGWG